MKKPLIVLLWFTAVFVASCCDCNNIEKQRAEILRLLAMERTAHFNGDVNMFVSEFSDSMISINRGLVQVTSPDSSKPRIEQYFKNTSFIKWDDAAAPIIRFSDDLTMAYAIVQKEVITLTKDPLGAPVVDTTHFTWASIYKKHEDGWKIECNVSTNK